MRPASHGVRDPGPFGSRNGGVPPPSRRLSPACAIAVATLVCGRAASAQVFEVSNGNLRQVDASGPPAAAARPKTPRSLARAVRAAAARYKLAPELLDTVARQESGYRPAAVSPAGAVGLMQLMPATARALGVNPTDPVQSLNGAAAYLRSLLDRFDGRLDLALAAYDAGPGAVERYAGTPPYRETRAYVSASLDRLARDSLAASSTSSTPDRP
ncbi:MAG TPA: lytic transglycosylase domain-containing protein [Caulobacteraceae bacterium]